MMNFAYTDCCICMPTVGLLSIAYSDCCIWWLSLCWVSLILAVACADFYMCWLSYMLTVVYTDCHLCWLSLTLSAVPSFLPWLVAFVQRDRLCKQLLEENSAAKFNILNNPYSNKPPQTYRTFSNVQYTVCQCYKTFFPLQLPWNIITNDLLIRLQPTRVEKLSVSQCSGRLLAYLHMLD